MTYKGSLLGILAVLLALRCGKAGNTAAKSTPTVDPAIAAYQALVTKDDHGLDTSTSNHCHTIADTACPAAAGRVIVALQQWAQDLKQFQTPTRFVTIDRQLQRHLAASMSYVGAIATANRAQDQAGEDLAVQIALTELSWLDGISASIAQWAPATSTIYTRQVGAEMGAFDACAGCPQLTGQGQLVCFGAAASGCDSVLTESFNQIQAFQAGLLEIAAPDSLVAKDAILQLGLAQADSDLLAIKGARLAADEKAFEAARGQFTQAMVAVHTDAAAI
jgi:hypothetical protein